MSDPRALAAKMAGRPIDYGAVGGGTPRLGLTGLDIAGALSMGGARREESLMVMLKWVQDKSVQEPLFYILYDRVVGLAVKRGWKVRKGEEFLRKLTRLAIAEIATPNLCPTCNGRREVWLRGESLPTKCPHCNGVGVRDMEDQDRAALVGITKSSWCELWRDRYPEVRGIMERVEAAGLSALSRGIQDL